MESIMLRKISKREGVRLRMIALIFMVYRKDSIIIIYRDK